MKLRKTLGIIMAAALTVGTMAGCSQTTLNYAKELSNTAKWGATTSSIEGAVNVDAQGVQKQIKFTANGYTSDDKAYVDMTFTDPSGEIKIPELKVYSDGTTGYINKSFYQGICSLEGQAVPEGLANVKEEYIGIESGADATKLKSLMTQEYGMTEYAKMIFGENSDLDLPFVQNGREYTLNLDSDKTVDLAAKALKAMGNNMDNLNNNLKMGLPADNITQIKTLVNSSEFDSKLPEIKAALAGSTITSKDTFTDTSYNSDFNINLKVKDFGNISLTMKVTAAKSDAKEISFPTSTLKVTQEQFAQMMAKTNTAIAAN